jgi:hypothetical protein
MVVLVTVFLGMVVLGVVGVSFFHKWDPNYTYKARKYIFMLPGKAMCEVFRKKNMISCYHDNMITLS